MERSYDGSFVYKNNELQFMSQPEGYVKYDSGINSFSYVYQFKDHLGNIRLSYTDANNSSSIEDGEIIEENNYYAFGMKHAGYNPTIIPHWCSFVPVLWCSIASSTNRSDMFKGR